MKICPDANTKKRRLGVVVFHCSPPIVVRLWEREVTECSTFYSSAVRHGHDQLLPMFLYSLDCWDCSSDFVFLRRIADSTVNWRPWALGSWEVGIFFLLVFANMCFLAQIWVNLLCSVSQPLSKHSRFGRGRLSKELCKRANYVTSASGAIYHSWSCETVIVILMGTCRLENVDIRVDRHRKFPHKVALLRWT